MSRLTALFDASVVSEMRNDIEARNLDRQVNPNSIRTGEGEAAARLRVAAIASYVDLVGLKRVEDWLKRDDRNMGDSNGVAETCFANWRGYLDGLGETDGIAAIDDLLFFAVAGFIADKPQEVRDTLRRPKPRSWLEHNRAQLPRLDWLERVRSYVSLAVLLTVRQEGREDIEAGGAALRELAGFQRTVESEWITDQDNQKRDALTLLAFYHLAEAVIKISEFLLAGSLKSNGRPRGIIPELRRLLVRAEEFLAMTGDSETILWLVTVGIGLDSLRGQSLWTRSRGISQRIDQLLQELTQSGRPHPVFSLLPSQQEAMRQAFLDASKLAIVLQMPTSSGKTLLAEFAIAQTFDAYRDRTRVVYLVPTRALATQVRRTLAEDLGPLGITVSAAGTAFEEDPYELELLRDTDGVVVATPEKLDLILRAHSDWFESLRLIIVDEAHLLHDGERGMRLELLLANIRREQPEVRMVLLTPFMENADEIARWLSPERGHAINVQWRPSRLLLGLANIAGRRGDWRFEINWDDPYNERINPKTLVVPIGATKAKAGTNTDRVLLLGQKLRPLGSVLAIFSASPADAEEAARRFGDSVLPLEADKQTPQLRLAISLARHEFGEDSTLASCLERGVAYHHSSLSPILRYLIEDQIRGGALGFVAATSTLAQGMNFPVATVLVHSVHKPRGLGNLSSAEFWNIAGRAGRVGMVEQGLVVFADANHKKHLEHYSSGLKNVLASALLTILPSLRPDRPLKDQYREIPALRPFVQYLAHAAANTNAADAIANLEELLQQSLANHQIKTASDSQKLRNIARSYLQQLIPRESTMLRAADQTGLATFSFDELYAKLRNDPVLNSGPQAILDRGEAGFSKLVEALRWLPELNLAIGLGPGSMNVQAVGRVVDGWVAGRQIHELAASFPGPDVFVKRRNAARYLYGTVSQTLSWGTHAYLRGWLMSGAAPDELPPEDKMLPAYIQFGVHTPEAAVASLLGVPRPFAEALGAIYRERSGGITPETASQFRDYVETVNTTGWQEAVERSGIVGVRSEDLKVVYRQMQGLPVDD
jgi:DEAD/DEAH box helicase